MLSVRVDDHNAQELLKKLRRKLGNLRAPLSEAGAIIHGSIMQNFEVGGRHSGDPKSWRGGSERWEPLKASTLMSRNSRFRRFGETKFGDLGGGEFQLRTKQKTAILINSARLRNSIHFRADADSMTIGTNLPYAAIQNFGGETSPHVIRARNAKALAWPGGVGPRKSVNHPGSKIPARPYMVVQDEDMMAVANMFRRYLTQ